MKIKKKNQVHFKQLLQKPAWTHFNKYGGNTFRKPCKRIIKTSYKPPNPLKNKFGKTLKCYQVTYMDEHKETPKSKKQIGHICANPYNLKKTLCCEISHMTQQTQKENNERSRHHNVIRQWEMSQRFKNNGTEKGPMYLKHVPLKFYCEYLRKRGFKKDITDKMKKKLRQNINAKSWCNHSPRCFINYKLISNPNHNR